MKFNVTVEIPSDGALVRYALGLPGAKDRHGLSHSHVPTRLLQSGVANGGIKWFAPITDHLARESDWSAPQRPPVFDATHVTALHIRQEGGHKVWTPMKTVLKSLLVLARHLGSSPLQNSISSHFLHTLAS